MDHNKILDDMEELPFKLAELETELCKLSAQIYLCRDHIRNIRLQQPSDTYWQKLRLRLEKLSPEKKLQLTSNLTKKSQKANSTIMSVATRFQGAVKRFYSHPNQSK